MTQPYEHSPRDFGVFKRRYRRWQYYFGMTCGWLMVALCLLLAVMPADPHDKGTDIAPVFRILFAVACPLMAWVLYRTSRMLVEVSDDGVFIRNVLRNHRLSWEQIDSISGPADPPTPFKAGVRFHLVDGRTVTADAITTALFDWADPSQELQDAVNRQLMLRRHSPLGSPGPSS